MAFFARLAQLATVGQPARFGQQIRRWLRRLHRHGARTRRRRRRCAGRRVPWRGRHAAQRARRRQGGHLDHGGRWRGFLFQREGLAELQRRKAVLAERRHFRIAGQQHAVVGQQGGQVGDGGARGRLVEINQQVAAEDDVVMAAAGGGVELQQVALPEGHLFAQGVDDAVGVIGHVREITLAEGHVLGAEGVAAVHAGLRPFDAAGTEVIRVDAEGLFRHSAVAQRHGHRIRFLAARAGDRQDARGAPARPAFLHQFDGGVERLRVAEQPRFGHHHQFDQLRHFGRRERLQVGGTIAKTRLLHALADGPLGHGFGDGQAGRAAQQGLCRHAAPAS